MVIKEQTEIQKYESFGSIRKLFFAILIAHQSLITLIALLLVILLPTLAFQLGWPNPIAYFITILVWLMIAGVQTLAIMMNPKKWLLSELID